MAANSYDNMVNEVSNPFCWACGRGHNEKPTKWFAPWMIQRCHLAAGSGRMKRIEERWYVNLLCPLCHALHRHKFTEIRIFGTVLPALTDAAMLWIKADRDRQWWDMQRIQRAWIGNPPSPESPHEYFLNEYALRRMTRLGI